MDKLQKRVSDKMNEERVKMDIEKTDATRLKNINIVKSHIQYNRDFNNWFYDLMLRCTNSLDLNFMDNYHELWLCGYSTQTIANGVQWDSERLSQNLDYLNHCQSHKDE